jgi:hypothetical protein
MTPQETLDFIQKRYNLDLNQPNPIQIPASRWHDLGHLLNDLDYTLGVEIGVYRGRFTATLAKRAPKMQLVGVDAWKVYPGYKDYCDSDLEDEAYLDAVRRTEIYPQVKLVNDWSVEASKMFKDESLDYIFIDANHSYEWVVEDMKAWIPKVKTGGIVMGHDYFVMKKLNFGVIQAVNGWVETHFIKHLFKWTDNCPCWMFIKGDTTE